MGQRDPPGPAGQRGVPVLDGVLDGVATLPRHKHRQEGGRVEEHGLARVEEAREQEVERQTTDALVGLKRFSNNFQF